MTDSAYLKSVVGPLLAKAVAETVLAQPSNPQEYLALYLLHVLQQEECRAAAASMKQKAEAQRQEWARERALREKRAADTIRRAFRQYRKTLLARRAAENALWVRYEQAEEEADELLDEHEVTAQKDAVTPEEDARRGSEEDGEALEAAAEAVEERRREFYRAQRFMLYIRKALVGALKTELVNRRELVRVEQDKVQYMLDEAEEELREKDEADMAAVLAKETLPSSGAAATLVKQVMIPRHEKISAPMILYRVLRCWCYLFFNCTPKQTDTPAKVAALVKPFTFMQLFRAFNPVATYQRNKPLRLESKDAKDDEDDAADELMQEGGGDPLPQPKPRQARRVSRVLRVLLHDCEYISSVNPADYVDSEEETEEAQGKSPSAFGDRASEVTGLVEAAAKKHSVMLYALLRLLTTASAYRDARDRWVDLLQQNGHELPASEELPEDDDADSDNEEGLRDDDGEVDVAAVQRLLLSIGVDTDEALSKLWAGRDDVERKKWEAIVAARAREEEEEEEEDSETNKDSNDSVGGN